MPSRRASWVTQGKHDEAERVVSRFEQRVQQAVGHELPPVDPDAADEEPPHKFSFGKAIRFLWSPSMWRITATTWLIWFVITFSYYGFFTWIPTLLVNRGISVTTSYLLAVHLSRPDPRLLQRRPT